MGYCTRRGMCCVQWRVLCKQCGESGKLQHLGVGKISRQIRLAVHLIVGRRAACRRATAQVVALLGLTTLLGAAAITWATVLCAGAGPDARAAKDVGHRARDVRSEG